MYLCQQRAVQSPEPEGSEMMLHHSVFMIAKIFVIVKKKEFIFLIFSHPEALLF